MVPCWNKIILGRSTDGGGSGLKFFKIILFWHETTVFVINSTAVKHQISKLYPQIQRTDASDHIYVSQQVKMWLQQFDNFVDTEVKINIDGPIK